MIQNSDIKLSPELWDWFGSEDSYQQLRDLLVTRRGATFYNLMAEETKGSVY
jgi:hypothetical protein